DDSHHGWAFTNRRFLLRFDLENEMQFPSEHRVYAHGIRSFCAVPLIVRGESIGVINLLSYTKSQYSETDAQFLQEVANQIALAVKSHQEIAASRAQLEAKNVDLQQERERLRLIIDTIPAMVWVSSPDGSVEIQSGRCIAFTGLPEEKLLGWD